MEGPRHVRVHGFSRLTGDAITAIDVSTSTQNDTLISDIHANWTLSDILAIANQSANNILCQIVQQNLDMLFLALRCVHIRHLVEVFDQVRMAAGLPQSQKQYQNLFHRKFQNN